MLRDEKGHVMSGQTVIVVEFVRALQAAWNIDDKAQPIDDQALVHASAIQGVREPVYLRLLHQIDSIARQVPNRHQTADWFGRRLITWGWHIRTYYGSSNR